MSRENNTSLSHLGFWPSNNSECEILNGTVTGSHRKHNRKSIPCWNAPRKVKAVDSLGRITENHSFSTLRIKKRKSRINTKRCSRILKLLKRYKHVEDLSLHKVVTSNLNSFKVKKSALEYEASPKIIALAKTKEPVHVYEKAKSWKMKKTTFQHRLSERITKLAEPRVHNVVAINVPGKINEKALFATASKRVNELALPRNLPESEDSKQNPFGVNPQALRAVCSSRLKELAKPKRSKVSVMESSYVFSSGD